MAFSSLASARGLGGLAACVAALGLVAGCHSGAAGGNTHDGGNDAAADTMEKLPPPDAQCPTDAAGGGMCPLNFCGAPKSVAALGAGQAAELGADDVCTPGYVCVPDAPTADGTALQLRCVSPAASAAPFGADCQTGATATSRCKNDALCIEGAPVAGSFCSELCRADADCPQDSYCLEYKSDTLPNGSYVNLAFCTPKAKIGGTICTSEASCAADEGCVVYGGRTNLMTCQRLGGAKSVGDRCAKSTECRSGQCIDRDFHIDSNQSYCTAPCSKSSDCGADQRCTRIVLGNNGTPADPRDDLVVGLCQSLFVSIADSGCKTSAECAAKQGGGDTCATKYGLCYTAGAASGAPCTTDQQCALGAFCNKTFQNGYCQTLGCAPGAAAGSVDSCPGAHAVCAQRGSERPLFACYEGCGQTSDCSRVKDLYDCEAVAGVDAGASSTDAGATDAASDAATDADASGAFVPAGICLYNQGV